MARRSSTTDEIKALAEELRTPRKRKPSKAAEAESESAETVEDVFDDAASLVGQLRDALEEGLEDTREFTGNHPVAALSAAFLLGLVVGRLWRAA